MIRRTSAPLPQRMRAMQNVVHAVISYHGEVGDYEGGGYRFGARGARRF
jgi:hypothetical protein